MCDLSFVLFFPLLIFFLYLDYLVCIFFEINFKTVENYRQSLGFFIIIINTSLATHLRNH